MYSVHSEEESDVVDDVVKLNVGGKLFVTSRTTLLYSLADTSFFSALLSGGQHHTILDGGIFIDRDPRLFEIVLTYMRTGFVRSAQVDLRELLCEAEFYGLEALAQTLSLQIPEESCGGLLFDGLIPCPPIDEMEHTSSHSRTSSVHSVSSSINNNPSFSHLPHSQQQYQETRSQPLSAFTSSPSTNLTTTVAVSNPHHRQNSTGTPATVVASVIEEGKPMGTNNGHDEAPLSTTSTNQSNSKTMNSGNGKRSKQQFKTTTFGSLRKKKEPFVQTTTSSVSTSPSSKTTAPTTLTTMTTTTATTIPSKSFSSSSSSKTKSASGDGVVSKRSSFSLKLKKKKRKDVKDAISGAIKSLHPSKPKGSNSMLKQSAKKIHPNNKTQHTSKCNNKKDAVGVEGDEEEDDDDDDENEEEEEDEENEELEKEEREGDEECKLENQREEVNDQGHNMSTAKTTNASVSSSFKAVCCKNNNCCGCKHNSMQQQQQRRFVTSINTNMGHEDDGDLDYDNELAIVKIVSCQLIVAVAHKYRVFCYRYSESHSWSLVSRSARMKTPIDNIAINIRTNSARGGDSHVAISSGENIFIWNLQQQAHLLLRDATSPTQLQLHPNLQMHQQFLQQQQQQHHPHHNHHQQQGMQQNGDPIFSDDEDADGVDQPVMTSVSLTVPVDDLLFIHNCLVAISLKGKIGVRNARTHVWQVQDIGAISCHASSGSLLLFGTHTGKLYLIDMEKFPLRLKDNDLLVSLLYEDDDGASITALSVYETSSSGTDDRCVEIAYGTSQGHVRVILQHPETIGQSPVLYKTYRVHLCPIKSIKLNRSCLISVCSNSNHVREWKLTRFRGRISTQPGTQSIASFSLPSTGNIPIGPYGDADEEQVFVQQPGYLSDHLIVTPTSGTTTSGQTSFGSAQSLVVSSADESPITTFSVHEGSMSTRAGAHSIRFLFTGHLNGAVQVWNLLSNRPDKFDPYANQPISGTSLFRQPQASSNKSRDLGFVSTSINPHRRGISSTGYHQDHRSNNTVVERPRQNTLSSRADVAMLQSYHRRMSALTTTSDI
eukprot:m.217407 g.217407  ORF g.217407 m.217407 type:complete len:1053 (-) comp13811_c0_seq4:75-3233(-)